MVEQKKNYVKIYLYSCPSHREYDEPFDMVRKIFVPPGTNYCLTFKQVTVFPPRPVAPSEHLVDDLSTGGQYRAFAVSEALTIGQEPVDMGVYVKWAFDPKRIRKLHHEAAIYEHKLGPLQGRVVPRFYGYFVDNLKEPRVACSIFESLEFRPYHSIDEWKWVYSPRL